MMMMFIFYLSEHFMMKTMQRPLIYCSFVRKENRLFTTAEPLTKWLCCISAKGYLFHWTVHLGTRRFHQSASGRSSVAEATGGKVNLGYSNEGPAGERVTHS